MLIHHDQFTAQLLHAGTAETHRLPCKLDAAGGGRLQKSEDIQQGGFTCSIGTKQTVDPALLDFQRRDIKEGSVTRNFFQTIYLIQHHF